jgi:hypothetical protein
MRVSGPSSTNSAAPARRAGPRPATGFSAPEGEEEIRSAAGVSGLTGAAGVGSVAALLALQGVESEADAAGRAAKRAGGLLDVLESLKLAMLEGRGVAGRLQDLAARTAEARAQTGDPRLEAILDEVEIRAAVELAKHAAA